MAHLGTGLNEVQLPKDLQRGTMWSASGLLGSLNEVQLPKELQLSHSNGGRLVPDASMKCSSRRNCNQLRGDLQGHGVDASMKCSSRRNCNAAGPLHLGGVDAASMKCSSRRNCNSPLSIACHQAHLRPLRERSVRGLGLSRICLQLSPPNPCRSNVLSLRALPEVLRAPERSRQAMSGPSDVMVLVRPT